MSEVCCPWNMKVKSNLSDREMMIGFFWWSKDLEGYWKEGLYIEYFWLGRGGECWYWNWLVEERVAVSHQPPFQQQVFSNVLTEVLQWIYSTQYLKLQVSLMDWRKWHQAVLFLKILRHFNRYQQMKFLILQWRFQGWKKDFSHVDLNLRRWRARVQVAWVSSLRIWLFWGSAL